MAIIYVTNDFKQNVGDIVLFSSSIGAELDTNSPSSYTDWLISRPDAEEIFYKEKLESVKRKRLEEYSKLNQEEMMYDDQINGTNKWKETLDRIRINNPFPSRPISVPVPEGSPTITELKSLMWSRIQVKRNFLTENGGFLVGTKWFHSDSKSRNQQLGLVLLGQNIPPNTQWKTMDGSFIQMTPTLAVQILGSAALSDIAIFAAAELHKNAMEAFTDPEKYDYSTGWPTTFIE